MSGRTIAPGLGLPTRGGFDSVATQNQTTAPTIKESWIARVGDRKTSFFS